MADYRKMRRYVDNITFYFCALFWYLLKITYSIHKYKTNVILACGDIAEMILIESMWKPNRNVLEKCWMSERFDITLIKIHRKLNTWRTQWHYFWINPRTYMNEYEIVYDKLEKKT